MDAATGLDLDPWRLTPVDHALIAGKHRANRLTFAVMLLFFRERGRFPRATDAIDAQAVAAFALTIDAPVPADLGALLIGDLTERTMECQRAEIRALSAFREATVDDAAALGAWLRDHVVAQTRDLDRLVAALEERCRALSIEPPTLDRVQRIARMAVRAYEERGVPRQGEFAGAVACLARRGLHGSDARIVFPSQHPLPVWVKVLHLQFKSKENKQTCLRLGHQSSSI